MKYIVDEASSCITIPIITYRKIYSWDKKRIRLHYKDILHYFANVQIYKIKPYQYFANTKKNNWIDLFVLRYTFSLNFPKRCCCCWGRCCCYGWCCCCCGWWRWWWWWWVCSTYKGMNDNKTSVDFCEYFNYKSSFVKFLSWSLMYQAYFFFSVFDKWYICTWERDREWVS